MQLAGADVPVRTLISTAWGIRTGTLTGQLFSSIDGAHEQSHATVCRLREDDVRTEPGIRRLHRSDLPIDTIEMARYLIGKTLVHDIVEGRMSGRIVETEAYVLGDASGHAFHGLTSRNRSLYLERGHAYVYLVYGSSHLLNVTSELPGVGAGVLLRALEPLEGIGLMLAQRRTTRVLDLARGPGRIAAAMRIDRGSDGIDLCSDTSLWIGQAVRRPGPIGESVRIGVTRETERLLRFYESGNPHVSGPKRLRV
jgi:DNA-3-methyladenine glycosylase